MIVGDAAATCGLPFAFHAALSWRHVQGIILDAVHVYGETLQEEQKIYYKKDVRLVHDLA